MKSLAAELAYFLRRRARQNLKALILYCAFLAGIILVYATLFRYLMWNLEGREFSFIAGIYWTITVMTTLGFGDITFHSDPGYLFAAVVTISGVVFLLIILPFGLISLFLAPWIEHRLRYHPSLELPSSTTGHVLIFGIDPIARTFIRKLQTRNIPFVVITDDYEEGEVLEEEQDAQVIYGSPTDRNVLTGARVESARYVIANLGDPENANLCLTVRSLCKTPIAAMVLEPDHAEPLRLAGANQVIPLQKILGRYLATRATTRGALAHVIDSFGSLQIAEIPIYGTDFVGLTLEEARIRQRTGLAVIGVWERGVFTSPSRETVLQKGALMMLAGTREQLEVLEQLTGGQAEDDFIFILGHGRIGCAAAAFLERKPVPFIVVDQRQNPECADHTPVIGDAKSRLLLKKAGVDKAKGLVVTTNDDSTNIFLTLTSRHSNANIRIVARANRDENADQLYAAGADFVVSRASVGASILINVLESKESVFLTEGINVFRRPLPPGLAGKSIADSRIRSLTGCSIVALEPPKGGEPMIVPPPETVLVEEVQLILIGSPAQEQQFGQTLGQG